MLSRVLFLLTNIFRTLSFLFTNNCPFVLWCGDEHRCTHWSQRKTCALFFPYVDSEDWTWVLRLVSRCSGHTANSLSLSSFWLRFFFLFFFLNIGLHSLVLHVVFSPLFTLLKRLFLRWQYDYIIYPFPFLPPNPLIYTSLRSSKLMSSFFTKNYMHI